MRRNQGTVGIWMGLVLLALFFAAAWFMITHIIQIATAVMIMLLPIFFILIMAILAKKFLFQGGGK